MQNFATLSELVLFQASSFNNPRALNFKENNQWRSFSNQEFLENIFHFACGLKEIGFQKNQTLANFSYQNPIWLIVDLGTILAGGVTVPIFDNISDENLFFEISDAKINFLFTDHRDFSSKKIAVEKIITYGFEDNSTSFETLISLGKKAVVEKKYKLEEFVKSAQKDDLATIIYTSGSTGNPKGVELTHGNLVSQIHDTAATFALDSKSDIALSFLPLAHIFERMVMMFYISKGITVYFSDDVKNLGNLMKELRPSLITSVPRMLEKVFFAIKEKSASGNFLKRYLAAKALQFALAEPVASCLSSESKHASTGSANRWIFDLLVYKKFRAAFGGNMKMIICGGAALSQDMERFYNNIGIPLFCGYGMTESSPVLAVNSQTAHKFGTVGKAFPSVELKISADGELLAKGENIMRGYHHQPQKTAETIIDGWLHTGDLAHIDNEGFVKINGRKKELFKNANGKYVRPIPLEQKLVQELGFLIGAIVIAEGRRFTSALLFPDFEILEKFKKKFNFDGSNEEFLKSKNLQNFVQKKIEEINANLDHWEQIQKFHISLEEISISNGGVTSSMKLKRSFLEQKYQNIIENFYQN
jgi:long-chain acyl-CoA synthetase